MNENKSNHTILIQVNKNNKKKFGRSRKHTTEEKQIKFAKERQSAEKRRVTQFKKELRKIGYLVQLWLISVA